MYILNVPNATELYTLKLSNFYVNFTLVKKIKVEKRPKIKKVLKKFTEHFLPTRQFSKPLIWVSSLNPLQFFCLLLFTAEEIVL